MEKHAPRGLLGTKFVIVVLAMLLATGCFVLLDMMPVASAQFATLVSALNGLAALYCMGNVAATKFAPRPDDKPQP